MKDVIVENSTGSSKRPAKLHLATGLLEFECGHWSSIATESQRGKVYNAPVAEIKVEAPAEEAIPSLVPTVRSEKKNKKKT